MFTVTIENFAVIRGLTELPYVVERETTNLFVDMAMWIKADLKKRVPSETGKLRNSIRYQLSENGSHKEATFYGLDYWKFVDQGTGLFGPKRAEIQTSKVMAFTQHGQRWFHKRLSGQHADEFVLATFQHAIDEADHQVTAAANRIFRTVIGG